MQKYMLKFARRWYSGCALAFQAKEEGSIPFCRSKGKMKQYAETRIMERRSTLLHVMGIMRAALNSDGRRYADKFWPRLWHWNQSPRKRKK
jgi:hypothetical protein